MIGLLFFVVAMGLIAWLCQRYLPPPFREVGIVLCVLFVIFALARFAFGWGAWPVW